MEIPVAWPDPDPYEIKFAREHVPASATALLLVRVDRSFAPTRMRFSPSTAENFFIEDIRIGGRAQFTGDGFDADLVNRWDHVKQFEHCQSFMCIKVVFTNKTKAPCSFHGLLIGTAIDPMKLTGIAREHYQRDFELFAESDRILITSGRAITDRIGGIKLPS